jgi:hypothetical protein
VEKTNVLLIPTGLTWAMQWVRLIVESVTFATTLVSERVCWRLFEEKKPEEKKAARFAVERGQRGRSVA